MNRISTICAYLLAIPLIGSGANFLFDIIPSPTETGFPGERILASMETGGLIPWLAIGHFALGVLLILPRWRFLAGLLQLPITLGIVAFNSTLFPPGLPLALAMLIMNLGVLFDFKRLRSLLSEEVGLPTQDSLSRLKPHLTEQAR
jgi:hypothetical protein